MREEAGGKGWGKGGAAVLLLGYAVCGGVPVVMKSASWRYSLHQTKNTSRGALNGTRWRCRSRRGQCGCRL